MYKDKCTVKAVGSGKAMEADVIAFNEKRNLTLAVNTVKLMMTWTGRVYEGRMAGMDFESEGPAQITKYKGR